MYAFRENIGIRNSGTGGAEARMAEFH